MLAAHVPGRKADELERALEPRIVGAAHVRIRWDHRRSAVSNLEVDAVRHQPLSRDRVREIRELQFLGLAERKLCPPGVGPELALPEVSERINEARDSRRSCGLRELRTLGRDLSVHHETPDYRPVARQQHGCRPRREQIRDHLVVVLAGPDQQFRCHCGLARSAHDVCYCTCRFNCC